MERKLRCCKCFVTLERLKDEGVCDYLVRILKENGEEDSICQTCFSGW